MLILFLVSQEVCWIRQQILDQRLLLVMSKIKSLDFILGVSKNSDLSHQIDSLLLVLLRILSFSVISLTLRGCSLDPLLTHEDAALSLVMPDVNISDLIEVVGNDKC